MDELEKSFKASEVSQRDIEIKSLVEANGKLRWQLDELRHNINLLFGFMDIDFPDAMSYYENLINKIRGKKID